jgi:hypothetical protein
MRSLSLLNLVHLHFLQHTKLWLFPRQQPCSSDLHSLVLCPCDSPSQRPFVYSRRRTRVSPHPHTSLRPHSTTPQTFTFYPATLSSQTSTTAANMIEEGKAPVVAEAHLVDTFRKNPAIGPVYIATCDATLPSRP